MTKQTEAMKLALEALIAATPVKAKDPQLQAYAIVALREALAEQPAHLDWTDKMTIDVPDQELYKAQPAQQEPFDHVAAANSALNQAQNRSYQIASAAQQEPFGPVTVRRLSQRFENHADQYRFYPTRQSPYLDNMDECYAVYTRPQSMTPLTDEQFQDICNRLSRQGGWDGDGWDLALKEAIEAAHGIGEKK